MDGKVDYSKNQAVKKILTIEVVYEKRIRKIFSESLKLDQQQLEIDQTHQFGKVPGKAEKSRPIVVTFLRFMDKLAIVESIRSFYK